MSVSLRLSNCRFAAATLRVTGITDLGTLGQLSIGRDEVDERCHRGKQPAT